VRYDTINSPIGELLLTGDAESITGIHMLDEPFRAPDGWDRDRAAFASAAEQLEAYFDGRLTDFDLPLAPQGSPFQREVWEALLEIPFGRTAGYGEIAARLGRPSAARAVGAANGRNPIAIVIPCHRVIGSAGSLTGYGGGLERKRWLLDLEAGRAQLGAG
jgi:methylated-DNA-[protein]-cysteine S-methyltransferase